ncbi:putative molybdenum carrier protein [Methylobacter sp. YRD-M1]|uniref:putative molybdenum carrier protein n=1 Tax=Methylobacter sp. YRD-M1 TaxID=2911520 RepID=UPI00227D5BCF|nr:putative molybdenum carrier protein [Methylobacter sp. YRD-M1]WAK01246.1 putative molybdenum carrier protein [Methylobacter sp. YRD-M1]
MLNKIVSGGQTGADRAALDAGIELGFPVGGYCPAGRLAEDGEIDARYPLTELSGGYRQRTRKNVEDSHGTVIFYDSALHDGTEQTLGFCMQIHKPHKLIDISLVGCGPASKAIRDFINDYHIAVLNVAGPRLSSCPGIYAYVKEVIKNAIKQQT